MSVLLHVEGRLNPSATQSHIAYIFNLTDGAERLNLSFSYYPKEIGECEESINLIQQLVPRFLEPGEEFTMDHWKSRSFPLKNLLTLSIDDPEGFRGAAHRHPPEQVHFLSEQEASAGFIPGRLSSGLWRVTISVHAVVTNQCEYCLRLWEGDNQA